MERLPVFPSTRGFLALVLFTFLINESVSQAAKGDSCSDNGVPGVCTLTRDCPAVYSELLAGRPPTKFCGFEGFAPLVCCASGPGKPSVTREEGPVNTVPFQDDGRGVVARAKCAEYAKSVYGLVIPPILSHNRTPVNVSFCALKSRTLIVGGTKAHLKEFPHMAAIGYNTGSGISWDCGGTLISERYVMTAAHCTYSPDWGRAAWVRLGDLNLVSDRDGAKVQEIKVVQRIRNPQYKRPLEYHDIALLQLEKDAEFNAFVRPACLPYSLPDIGTQNKAIATGWGRVEWAEEQGSNDLLKVTLALVPQPTCNESFFDGGVDDKLANGIMNKWQICAGEFGKDTCQGDSGGPLAIFNQDHDCMYNVIGITSLGRVCGSVVPGVYTRVYNYIPWIEEVVWPNGV